MTFFFAPKKVISMKQSGTKAVAGIVLVEGTYP